MIALVRELVLTMVLLGSLLTPRAEGSQYTVWQRITNGPDDFTSISGTLGRDGLVYLLAYRHAPFRVALMAYDLLRQTWKELAEPFEGPDHLVAENSRIYLVGGSLLPQSSSVDIFDPRSNSWSHDIPRSSLDASQCEHSSGAASLGADGRIFLVAGDDLDQLGNCTEAYTPKTHSWNRLADLPLGLSSPAATTGPDGRIYVLGGVTADHHASHFFATNRVEAYDPYHYNWVAVAPMPTARAGLAAVTGTDGRIYAIGGSPDPISLGTDNAPTRSLGTVEAYNPRTNTWSRLPSLHVPRYGLTAVMAPDGKIYAIGGVGSVVETYQLPLPARG